MGKMGGILDASSKTMFLIIPIVSGNYNNGETRGIIQHEIEHLFQQVKMGHSFSCKDKNGSILYYKAYTKISNTKEDKITRDIATLIYKSFQFEIDANINKLYGELESLNDKTKWREIYKRSGIFLNLIDFKSMHLFVFQNKNSEKVKQAFKDYGTELMNPKKFCQRMVKTIEYAQWKIGRMLISWAEENNIKLLSGILY